MYWDKAIDSAVQSEWIRFNFDPDSRVEVEVVWTLRALQGWQSKLSATPRGALVWLLRRSPPQDYIGLGAPHTNVVSPWRPPHDRGFVICHVGGHGWMSWLLLSICFYMFFCGIGGKRVYLLYMWEESLFVICVLYIVATLCCTFLNVCCPETNLNVWKQLSPWRH